MNEVNFADLLKKYKTNSLTEDELQLFLDCLATEDPKHIKAQFDQQQLPLPPAQPISQATQDRIFEGVRLRMPATTLNSNNWIPQGWAFRLVATILLIMVSGMAFMFWQKSSQLSSAKQPDFEIADAAVKVSFGQHDSLFIDSKLSEQYTMGPVQVSVDQAGTITYNVVGQAAGNKLPLTIETPKGKTTVINLQDGSKVWLNSESSLSFIPEFSIDSRNISLKGEAYFEVAKDQDRPFFVEAPGMQVRVLGTGFNMQAYAGMRARTTLLHGSVHVASGNSESTLKPAQQALLRADGTLSISTVELDEVMAWKSGNFVFNAATIDEVLLTLSRWYAFDKIHMDARTDDRFTAAVKRTKSLRTVLSQLEEISTYVFEIQGNELFVHLRPN